MPATPEDARAAACRAARDDWRFFIRACCVMSVRRAAILHANEDYGMLIIDLIIYYSAAGPELLPARWDDCWRSSPPLYHHHLGTRLFLPSEQSSLGRRLAGSEILAVSTTRRKALIRGSREFIIVRADAIDACGAITYAPQ